MWNSDLFYKVFTIYYSIYEQVYLEHVRYE